jgi:hypothetical protein
VATKLDDHIAHTQTKFALLEQKMDLMIDNHLTHIAADIKWLKNVVYSTAVAIIGLLLKLTIFH